MLCCALLCCVSHADPPPFAAILPSAACLLHFDNKQVQDATARFTLERLSWPPVAVQLMLQPPLRPRLANLCRFLLLCNGPTANAQLSDTIKQRTAAATSAAPGSQQQLALQQRLVQELVGYCNLADDSAAGGWRPMQPAAEAILQEMVAAGQLSAAVMLQAAAAPRPWAAAAAAAAGGLGGGGGMQQRQPGPASAVPVHHTGYPQQQQLQPHASFGAVSPAAAAAGAAAAGAGMGGAEPWVEAVLAIAGTPHGLPAGAESQLPQQQPQQQFMGAVAAQPGMQVPAPDGQQQPAAAAGAAPDVGAVSFRDLLLKGLD